MKAAKLQGQELEDLVDCTRYTPSSVNMQPFKYYLACEPETVAKIQPLTKWARRLAADDPARTRAIAQQPLLSSARIPT